ncbi:MAG: hypothetical protein PHZ17_09110 [Sulfurovum sp.]|nr:hypothetical protein [Sulfurovum sp.]
MRIFFRHSKRTFPTVSIFGWKGICIPVELGLQIKTRVLFENDEENVLKTG